DRPRHRDHAPRRRRLSGGDRRGHTSCAQAAGRDTPVMSRLLPDVVVSEGRPLTGRVVTISAGRVTELTPVGADEATHPDVVRLPGKALLPGTVNAHCHTFQSLLRGLGDD